MSMYDKEIGAPLNLAIGLSGVAWDVSRLGQLNKEHGETYLVELKGEEKDAELAWQVTNAFFTNEDTQLVRCVAIKSIEGYPVVLDGSFGVAFDGNENATKLQGMKYPPFDSDPYIPIDNHMAVYAEGGYIFKVLDTDYPSEGMATGLLKGQADGKTTHNALYIQWELLPILKG